MHNIEAEVNLSALRANFRELSSQITTHQIMSVVKGDAYGHGIELSVRALRDAGAHWFGTAQIGEACEVRRIMGREGRVLAWLYSPADFESISSAISQRVDLSVGSLPHLDAVAATSTRLGVTARIHLEFDSGLGRGGATAAEWDALVRRTSVASDLRQVEVVGVWTHFSYADTPTHAYQRLHEASFATAVAHARHAGLTPQFIHAASSTRALDTSLPPAPGNLVRLGLSLFGVSPEEGRTADDWNLQAVMTVRAPVVQVKRLPAGSAIGYGAKYVLAKPSFVALVPAGFTDGVPKQSAGHSVRVNGLDFPIAGSVNMDQLVLDLGDVQLPVGALATLIGSTPDGDSLDANAWGLACGTFGDEIVTRLGTRAARTYIDPVAEMPQAANEKH